MCLCDTFSRRTQRASLVNGEEVDGGNFKRVHALGPHFMQMDATVTSAVRNTALERFFQIVVSVRCLRINPFTRRRCTPLCAPVYLSMCIHLRVSIFCLRSIFFRARFVRFLFQPYKDTRRRALRTRLNAEVPAHECVHGYICIYVYCCTLFYERTRGVQHPLYINLWWKNNL